MRKEEGVEFLSGSPGGHMSVCRGVPTQVVDLPTHITDHMEEVSQKSLVNFIYNLLSLGFNDTRKLI